MNVKKGMVLLGIIAGLAGVYFFIEIIIKGGEPAEMIAVNVPALSNMASGGHEAFKENCAACHGASAGGTKQGPPLIHDIYNPGHHGDGSFYRAVKQGVRAHHWPFGNMPPQTQVTDQQIAEIIAFIRETQVANGIVSKPHKM
ncbi:c-type cytochrome [Sneathiella sp. P13V-1]|uniref:c-type cytochrome n=1 Tax=Sneathiella sp. P13V-1 TaxID=2697366 RepID=UPI00187B1810|nr:cytochrome c [Sneathiella sp. P13V-1]MBE7635460.1 c-type cytochrome [Sneathiella sp. P13V-1]